LHSGLGVERQLRYNRLVSSDRSTLSDAFRRAGWRAVGFTPADDLPWPEGTTFYLYARVHDRFDFGYHGPAFSFASMPDQYSLPAFPTPTAPLWPMDVFRNRFLDAFGTPPTSRALRPAR
jgi:hypothetical protein